MLTLPAIVVGLKPPVSYGTIHSANRSCSWAFLRSGIGFKTNWKQAGSTDGAKKRPFWETHPTQIALERVFPGEEVLLSRSVPSAKQRRETKKIRCPLPHPPGGQAAQAKPARPPGRGAGLKKKRIGGGAMGWRPRSQCRQRKRCGPGGCQQGCPGRRREPAQKLPLPGNAVAGKDEATS